MLFAAHFVASMSSPSFVRSFVVEKCHPGKSGSSDKKKQRREEHTKAKAEAKATVSDLWVLRAFDRPHTHWRRRRRWRLAQTQTPRRRKRRRRRSRRGRRCTYAYATSRSLSLISIDRWLASLHLGFPRCGGGRDGDPSLRIPLLSLSIALSLILSLSIHSFLSRIPFLVGSVVWRLPNQTDKVDCKKICLHWDVITTARKKERTVICSCKSFIDFWRLYRKKPRLVIDESCVASFTFEGNPQIMFERRRV